MTFVPLVRSHFKATSQRSTGKELLEISLDSFVLLTLVLFVISFTSIEFAHSPNSTLWPSNAILLAFLLRSVRNSRNYGLVFLGGGTAIVLANFASGYSPALITVLTIGNIVEVAIAWVLLTIYQEDDFDLTCIRHLRIFMMLAGGIAPLVSASIGATALAAAYDIPWMPIWLNWYASNAIGMIVVAPFLLSLRFEERHVPHIKKRYSEAFGVLALIVLVAVVASVDRPFLFIIAPVLLFATFRFGFTGVAAGTLVLALVASIFVVKGIGSAVLPQSDLSERI